MTFRQAEQILAYPTVKKRRSYSAAHASAMIDMVFLAELDLFAVSKPTYSFDTRPYLETTINGHEVQFLADTGATRSIISLDLWKSIFGHEDFPQASHLPPVRIRAVTGHKLTPLGTFMVPIQMGPNYTMTYPILVVDGVVTKALLGMDILSAENAIVETQTGRIRLPNVKQSWEGWENPHAEAWALQALPEGSAPELKPPRGICLATRQVTIETMRSAPIKVRVTTTHGAPMPLTTGTVDPALHHEGTALAALACIAETDKSANTFIVMLNTSYEPITIYRDEEVAFFQPEKHDNLIDISAIAEEMAGTAALPEVKPTVPVPTAMRNFIRNTATIGPTGRMRSEFLALLYELHDVISEDKYDIGVTSAVTHQVRLCDRKPVHMKQFRIPETHQHCINNYVTELLRKGCIRLSNSPYNSPVFCVPKANGELRVVQDFRRLNMASLDDKYVFREIQECLDQIGKRKSQIFSTIDLTSGFWQQELEEKSRPYTSFTVPGRGRYEWTRTPMGLKGSSSSFARLMDYVMAGVPSALTYIDDIMVHSTGMKIHLDDLRQTLTRLRRFGLKINLKKCAFGTTSVKYLGFKVSGKGVEPDPEKLEAIRRIPPPTTVKQIRQFIGSCNYFRDHVQRFSLPASRLSRLTTKAVNWKPGKLPPDALAAFEQIKTMLCSSPILGFPRMGKAWIVTTDAALGTAEAPGGLGAVLSQADDNGSNEVVIAYASRALKNNEKNYSAYLVEMAAASWGIDHFSHYLTGRRFTLRSDHKPLTSMSKVHTKTLNRLEHQQNQFQIKFEYCPGRHNQLADILSRNAPATGDTVNETTCWLAPVCPFADKTGHCDEEDDVTVAPYENMLRLHPIPTKLEESDELVTIIEEVLSYEIEQISALEVTQAQLILLQKEDPLIVQAYNWMTQGTLPKSPKEQHKLRIYAKDLEIVRGILYMRHRAPRQEARRTIWVPRSRIPAVIFGAHASLIGAHAGENRTVNRIRHYFWWPDLTETVQKHIKGCLTCQKIKPPVRAAGAHAPLQPLPLATMPNERIHIDLFGPIRTAKGQKKMLLVMTDAFTKWAELGALPNKEALTVANAINDIWLLKHSNPRLIISDQGREFCNKVFKRMKERRGIFSNRTSPIHPQSNSGAESFNRQIIRYFKGILNNKTEDWSERLGEMTMSYNTMVHSTTLQTPFRMMYLRDANLPHFEFLAPDRDDDCDDSMDERFRSQRECYKAAYANNKAARDAMTERYNRTAVTKDFDIGSRVLLYYPKSALPKGVVNVKFHALWKSGYTILERMGPVNYQIAHDDVQRTMIVHADRLKPERPRAITDTPQAEQEATIRQNLDDAMQVPDEDAPSDDDDDDDYTNLGCPPPNLGDPQLVFEHPIPRQVPRGREPGSDDEHERHLADRMVQNTPADSDSHPRRAVTRQTTTRRAARARTRPTPTPPDPSATDTDNDGTNVRDNEVFSPIHPGGQGRSRHPSLGDPPAGRPTPLPNITTPSTLSPLRRPDLMNRTPPDDPLAYDPGTDTTGSPPPHVGDIQRETDARDAPAATPPPEADNDDDDDGASAPPSPPPQEDDDDDANAPPPPPQSLFSRTDPFRWLRRSARNPPPKRDDAFTRLHSSGSSSDAGARSPANDPDWHPPAGRK